MQVQSIPSDPLSWNNIYMNADNRGCNACHDLESIVMEMDTYHGITLTKYATQTTLATCIACHSFYDPIRNAIHSLHLNNTTFNQMNGNCESCHYIDNDGNYLRWDEVKFDVLKGITEIPASEAKVDIRYDQDVITPIDHMFYKSIKNEPSDWLTDDSQITEGMIDEWKISIHGDVENPYEATVPELIEEFGTVTQVMKAHCCINGAGQALIFNAEVTGVPIEKIIAKAQPKEGVTTFNTVSYDTYGTAPNQYPLNYDFVVENRGLLVTSINGQTIPAGQGWPASVWMDNASAGNFPKHITDLIVTIEENPLHYPLLGDFIDPATGTTLCKPNSAVLSHTSGQIFEFGQELTFEGYADAWDEPITKIEYSLDKGKTWIEMDTPDTTSEKWVYWYFTYTPEAPGSYLLRIRTTSKMPDGTPRVCAVNTDFLFHVQ